MRLQDPQFYAQQQGTLANATPSRLSPGLWLPHWSRGPQEKENRQGNEAGELSHVGATPGQ